MQERIHKILAARGVASRRGAEKLMQQGRVTVNGLVVSALGSLADTEVDVLAVDGQVVGQLQQLVYLALHKPVGLVCTCRDTHQRPSINSLQLPDGLRLFPVGRLDMDSSGLLLLTNDGEFAHRLMHPSAAMWKTYLVEARGYLEEPELVKLRQGIHLTDGLTLPADVQIVAYGPQRTRLTVAIREGKNRQIRRMFGAIHHPVESLQRIAIGPLQLGDLPLGQWRHLTIEEIAALQAGDSRG